MPRGRRHGRGGAGAKSTKQVYDRKDALYQKAKAEGYRSRAAYKLIELGARYKLIRRGAYVLDLGCWPGGWLQVAADLAGDRGSVVGVDLKETDPVARTTLLTGDVCRAEVLEQVGALGKNGTFNVVLSDLSPNLSGIRDRDETAAAELNELALDIADRLLASRGNFLMKTFPGEASQGLLRRARGLFETAKLTRAEASRKTSTEMYLIGLNRKSP